VIDFPRRGTNCCFFRLAEIRQDGRQDAPRARCPPQILGAEFEECRKCPV
jgi:hypothetical protein